MHLYVDAGVAAVDHGIVRLIAAAHGFRISTSDSVIGLAGKLFCFRVEVALNE